MSHFQSLMASITSKPQVVRNLSVIPEPKQNPLKYQRRNLKELVAKVIASTNNADMLNTKRNLIAIRESLTLLNSSTSLELRVPMSSIKGHSLSISEINSLFVLHNSQSRNFRKRVSGIMDRFSLHKTVDNNSVPSHLPTLRKDILLLEEDLKILEETWERMTELETIIFSVN